VVFPWLVKQGTTPDPEPEGTLAALPRSSRGKPRNEASILTAKKKELACGIPIYKAALYITLLFIKSKL
jgi:hypothetical protein